MEALHGLVKAGKVRALGASAMYGYQFMKMQYAAERNGWTKFVSMQNHYNLLYREDERELIPIAMRWGLPEHPTALWRPAICPGLSGIQKADGVRPIKWRRRNTMQLKRWI